MQRLRFFAAHQAPPCSAWRWATVCCTHRRRRLYPARRLARLHALPPALHEQFRLAPGAWKCGRPTTTRWPWTPARTIRVDAADKLVWGTGRTMSPPISTPRVDAFYVAGPLDNSFGLGFRRQANGDIKSLLGQQRRLLPAGKGDTDWAGGDRAVEGDGVAGGRGGQRHA